MHYGYIGLGNLGAACAGCLLKAGFKVTVYDLNPKLAEPLLAVGATLAASAEELAGSVDHVITCLPSPAVSERVLRNILPKMRKGAHWLEMSTLGRDEVLALAAIAAEAGVRMMELPVTGGVPPARENLGKSKVQGAGVRSAADPTENPAGGDADKDGLPAFVDVDDDNDGKLDLVDSTFFSTETKNDGTLLGEANIFTALICGGDCVNLNAFNIDSPSDNAVAAQRLNKMINTFQGVFFSFNATTKYFSSRPDARFGYFNVDCTGISWCSGSSSRAVTISPDFDSGNQPADNALPLTGGSSNYADFCGPKVIARNPLNPNAKPATWPADTSYDQSMDEWLFSTCGPDNDGLPNIIPSKGTLQSGFSRIS